MGYYYSKYASKYASAKVAVTRSWLALQLARNLPHRHFQMLTGMSLPRGTYQPITTSWGANKYHGLTTKTINKNLSWLPHINKVQNKASKTLGLLKRTLHAAPPQVRQTAYEVLVRPMLEFATCSWARHTKAGIQTIERVQRSAARFVTGDYRRTSCVNDMCTNLVWNSLYIRKLMRDATVFFLNSL